MQSPTRLMVGSVIKVAGFVQVWLSDREGYEDLASDRTYRIAAVKNHKNGPRYTLSLVKKSRLYPTYVNAPAKSVDSWITRPNNHNYQNRIDIVKNQNPNYDLFQHCHKGVTDTCQSLVTLATNNKEIRFIQETCVTLVNEFFGNSATRSDGFRKDAMITLVTKGNSQ